MRSRALKITTKKFKTALPAITALLCGLLLASCMGMDSEVKISQNGSGSLSAQYRLSEDLVSFGELEANKDMLPVPLSEADVKKSLSGVQGLSFKSWSSRKDGTDLLITTVIGFDSLDALVRYLDPQGKMASHGSDGTAQTISFSLGDSIPKLDKDMKEAAKEAFAPYRFRFVFDLPGISSQASSSDPVISVVREGKKVSFEGKMADIVTLDQAPSLKLSW
jgi:hypothetical protein